MYKTKAKKNITKCSLNDAQLREAIAKKATELYEKSGKKPGKDLENWLEAEREVRSKFCPTLENANR